jgi:urease accessory protein
MIVPVFAHAAEGSGGFLSGLSHPVGGLDHILAMIAVGLWGAQLGKPSIWLLPITFPLMMASGAALGLMGYPLPGVEIGIASSAVGLGLMILLDAKPPIAISMIIVGFFAVFHGHAHGAELAPGQNGLLYSVGFVIATGLLHALGIAIGAVHLLKTGPAILRGLGALVLLGGLFFLGQGFGLSS